MPIVTFDTSVFIAHKPAELPAGFRMSAVVIQEMTAGAIDKSEVQYWNASRIAHEKAGTLLVPAGEDWWYAGSYKRSLARPEIQEIRNIAKPGLIVVGVAVASRRLHNPEYDQG